MKATVSPISHTLAMLTINRHTIASSEDVGICILPAELGGK